MPNVFSDARLLVVDDHPANVLALEALLERWGAGHVTSTTRSEEAADLARRCRPDLVLLDLHMPAPDGFEVLRRLHAAGDGGHLLPVLVLTADVTPETRRRALDLGARDYVTKPFDAVEVELRIRNLLAAIRHEQALAHRGDELEARVRARTRDLELSRLEVLDRLALAAEYRDDLTGAHTRRVARTAGLLAAAAGLPPHEARLIELAAPLHDVGKIGIPDSILRKSGDLSRDERQIMRRHTTIGGLMLAESSSPVLRLAEQIALSHHERWDGGGYPHGLRGEAIPLPARIVAVADVFDALCTQRPYKPPWSVDRSADEIVAESGTHFDPAIVSAFASLDHRALAPAGRFAKHDLAVR